MTVEQAVRAAVTVAAAHGLRVSDPVLLQDFSNALIHLRPAPVVARVARATALMRPGVTDHLTRDLAVSAYLAGRGVPVVRGSDELPPGPHVLDGFTMTFSRHVPHDLDRQLSPVDFARLLGELHEELRDYPGSLPSRMPFDDIAQLRPAYEPPMLPLGGQPLHGDSHPGNLLLTPAGPVWNDFEDTWRGPVEWDLACLRHTRRMDGFAAVAAYPHTYEPDLLEAWHAVRREHSACWHAAATSMEYSGRS